MFCLGYNHIYKNLFLLYWLTHWKEDNRLFLKVKLSFNMSWHLIPPKNHSKLWSSFDLISNSLFYRLHSLSRHIQQYYTTNLYYENLKLSHKLGAKWNIFMPTCGDCVRVYISQVILWQLFVDAPLVVT